MKRHMIKKRILSMLLCLSMILSNFQFAGALDGYGDSGTETPSGELGGSHEMDSLYYDANPTSGTIELNGSVSYKDTDSDSGIDWSPIVRPKQFDQPIKIIQYYMDEEGEIHSEEIYAQDDDSRRPFYLMFTYDRSGGGDFTIAGVPRTVTVEGHEYQVQYHVEIETPYECYNSNVVVFAQDDVKTGSQYSCTLDLELQTQELTLKPTVIPESATAGPTFVMPVTFTNKDAATIPTRESKIEKEFKPTEKTSVTFNVPIGVSYEVKQETTEGYKFTGEYITTVTGEEPEKVLADSAKGTIEKDKNVTISTVNYSQIVELPFQVLWMDNHSVKRPELKETDFQLRFRVKGTDEWIDYTPAENEFLGLSQNPVFTTERLDTDNTYYYTGLPSMDAYGSELEFDVEMINTPEGYVSLKSEPEGEPILFTLEETSGFRADLYWRDNGDRYGTRPKTEEEIQTIIDQLHLYKRIGEGEYEPVYDGATLPEGAVTVDPEDSGHWIIALPELKRYDDANNEFDYVLVQGTIDPDTQRPSHASIDKYTTYYSNGTGTFAHDYGVAHNGGKINELLRGEDVTFSFHKVWKDEDINYWEKEKDRPKTTVTLWRYVNDGVTTIDQAYTNGKAAQVIYYYNHYETIDTGRKDENGDPIYETKVTRMERLENIELSQTDDEHGYTYAHTFPKYDGYGREYIYFVRETMDGEHADDYVAKNEGGAKNGILNNGTITNVHREKAAVKVSKVWKNPSGLKDIDGVQVQLAIGVPTVDPETGAVTIRDLTVYDEALNSYTELTGDKKAQEQTASGFTEYISSADVMYYVNIFDEEGRAIDMTNAVIHEVVTKNGVPAEAVYEQTDDGIIGTVTFLGADGEEKTYTAQTAFLENSSQTDVNDKKFVYTLTNTITEKRDFTLEKVWSGDIPLADYAEIQSVNFKLYRVSTASDSAPTELVKNGDSDIWPVAAQPGVDWILDTNRINPERLDKYDPNGYEYIYWAEETSFTTANGIIPRKEYNSTWAVDHHHTLDKTRAVNYIPTPGGGYFSVSKQWNDNGDMIGRQDLKLRVFLKSDLEAALREAGLQADESNADWDTLGVPSADFILTSDDSYTVEISYAAIKTGLGKTEDVPKNIESYVVVEYAIGSKATNEFPYCATYSYKELYEAATSTKQTLDLDGVLETSNRKFNIHEYIMSSTNKLILRNTRTGETQLSGQKVWFDNKSSYRPSSVEFQLYRDGAEFTDIPEDVEVSDNAVLDHATGRVTVSGNLDMDSWAFTISGLPMYDDKAVPYAYTLDEYPVNLNNEHMVYIQKKVSTTLSEDSDYKHQNVQLVYENRLTGMTTHVAYKYWKDPATNPDLRPDLYMTLYRRKVSGTEEEMTFTKFDDYEDMRWTNETEENMQEGGLHENGQTGYNWKIEAIGLPEYDENGVHYEYMFKEEMNHHGSTVLGTYSGNTETKDILEDGEKVGTYEVFTNTLSDYMALDGKKTWTKLSGFNSSTVKLPDPTILLYRTSESELGNIQSMTDAQVAALVASGAIVLIDATRLTDKKDAYSFPEQETTLAVDGDPVHAYQATYKTEPDSVVEEGNTVTKVYRSTGDQAGFFLREEKSENGGEPVIRYYLPKYNDEGQTYYYQIREQVDDPIASQLYFEQNNNGTLTNEFRSDVNRRHIVVTKNWTGWDDIATAEMKYHSVTYQLWRYELKATGEVDEKGIPTFVYDEETMLNTIGTEPLKTGVLEPSDFVNGTASLTFEDLLVFSPNGVQYGYYVTEEAINGYKTYYLDENRSDDGNERCDILQRPEKWNDDKATKEDLTTNVGTINEYQQKGNVSIKGNKVWNDYNNMEELRPTKPIRLTLRRSTLNEKEAWNNRVNGYSVPLNNVELDRGNGEVETYVWIQDGDQWVLQERNPLTEAEKNKPYVTWEFTDDTWTYVVHKLERYAPNGLAYTYTLSEDAKTAPGYGKASDVSVNANREGELSAAKMTNSFVGTYYVRKNWFDGRNKYDLRPKNITIVLKRSTDGVNYEVIPWREGYPRANTDEASPYSSIVSLNMTADQVIEDTWGTAWEYTFKNLPTVDKNGNPYTYRCEETEINGVAIELDSQGRYTDGTYVRYYDKQTNEQTVVKNVLESTRLIVTKKWEGDTFKGIEDYYQTRPEKLYFKLQKRGTKVSVGDDDQPSAEEEQILTWHDVGYEFTISSGEDWTKTLEDLPVAEYVLGNDGKKYVIYNLQFRAVEKHADEEAKTAEGAENYVDVTQETDHKKESNSNISNLTNRLILDAPPTSIKITKKWMRVSDEDTPMTADFQLFYKKAEGEDTWHEYKNEGIHQTSTATETTTEVLTWSKLPRFDLDGNELVYKVEEKEIPNYKTYVETEQRDEDRYPTEYTFTNIEKQTYTVEKSWQNTAYADREDEGFTATFALQKKVGDGEWETIEDSEKKLVSTTANDSTQKGTWEDLEKFTTDGTRITYRAIETEINGHPVEDNTDGHYVVTYTYDDDQTSAAIDGTVTKATNRMIYGFINLSKEAAYLAPNVEPVGNVSLKDVEFAIYAVDDLENPYISGVKTTEEGLIYNVDGTYGTEHKYLIAGTYLLKEVSASAEYSVWKQGIQFTVGNAANTTGEHGTAWISTTTAGANVTLNLQYLPSSAAGHSYKDDCVPTDTRTPAYNLENRGIIKFTKTDIAGNLIKHHENSAASGESIAYFGVYADEGCTKQVAGMIAKDEVYFVLTDKDKNGNPLDRIDNRTTPDGVGVRYLRDFSDSRYPDVTCTLLSGTYYIREETAPAGYRLDTKVRKAVVDKLPDIETGEDIDLSDWYPTNIATIDGEEDYEWQNTPNKVTIYKRDQFGRNVELAEDAYLELTVSQGTFLTGENKIRLYPGSKAATTTTGEEITLVTYDADTCEWTLTGLLDAGKTYTLSEPASSVPVNNIVADPFTFTMNTAGSMIEVSADAFAKADPLEHDGQDFKNYYKSNANGNIIVLRDISKFMKDVTVKKTDFVTGDPIENISFLLYKKTGTGETEDDYTPVLGPGEYLTTNADGEFTLFTLEGEYHNNITGCALQYGLDIGKYYLQEVERGASDQYRLADKVYFEIKRKEIDHADNPEEYAEVIFQTNEHVTQETGAKLGQIANDPVTEQAKHLTLSKLDASDSTKVLAGAHFVLTYKSITNNDTGSSTDDDTIITIYAVTGEDGQLYEADQTWTIKTDANGKVPVDISNKGTYTLKEVLAPDTYMTRTDATQKEVTLLIFKVNTDNEIITANNAGDDEEVMIFDGTNNAETDNALVQSVLVEKDETTQEDTGLKVVLTNDQTIVTVTKRDDIENGKKTKNQQSLNGGELPGAVLEIFEGTDTTGTPVVTLDGVTDPASSWKVEGELKENTIYTLHEKETPVGYLPADDLYFYLYGTLTQNGKNISKVYVWNGENAPASIAQAGWSETKNLKNHTLTMVDETVIAPLNMQKVVGDDTYEILPGAIFEVWDKDTNKCLGTAITQEDGYLVWARITQAGTDQKVIFDTTGTIVTAFTENLPIILQQNENGYRFKETYAPDHAYNSQPILTAKITDDNYVEYKASPAKYIDIVAANKETTEGKENTVDSLTARNSVAEATDLVNPAFITHFRMYKYDAEHPGMRADHNYSVIGLGGVTFTLSKKQANGEYEVVNTYTTSAEEGSLGLLAFDIHEKGEYLLQETIPKTGYEINTKEMTFTIGDAQYKQTLTYDENEETGIKLLVDAEGQAVEGAAEYELPNNRKHGMATLIKQDAANATIKLNGVSYILKRKTPAENSLVDHYVPSYNADETFDTGLTYQNLYQAEDYTEITTVTAADGALVLKELPWGTYVVKEVKENDGYILREDEFEFTIDAEHLEVSVTDNGKEFIDNSKNQLTVKKTDLNGQKLEKATFVLYPVTNGKIDTTVMAYFYSSLAATERSTSQVITAGETTIYGLIKGTYVLHETLAPEGYELAEDVILTMQADGKVVNVRTCTVAEDGTVTEKTGDASAVVTLTTGTDEGTNNPTNTVAVKDRPIEVKLTKKLNDGTADGILLTNIEPRGMAAYTIEGIFAGETTKTTRTLSGNVIQDALKAQLKAGQTYVLKETKAPNGYEVQTAEATIYVNEDGTIDITVGDSFLTGNNDEDVAALVYADDPIEIDIAKKNAQGLIDQDLLGYAEFTVSGLMVGTDGVSAQATETGLTANPTDAKYIKTVLSKRLIADQIYMIKETKAPAGYILTDPIYVKIDKFGEIIARGDSEDALSEMTATDILDVIDAPTEISFLKKDDESHIMTGVEFTITAMDTTLDPAFVNLPETLPEGWSPTELRWTSDTTKTTFTNHLIADVHYILTETNRVNGYEIMDNRIEFHLERDGSVVIDANATFVNYPDQKAVTQSADTLTLTVINPIVRGDMELTKYWKDTPGVSDEAAKSAGQTLAGAQYQLTMVKDKDKNTITPIPVKAVKGSDGNYHYSTASTASDIYTTDANGKIVVKGLPEGTYEFVEVAAPYAYHVNYDTVITFAVEDREKAHHTTDQYDTRINAVIKLTKLTGTELLPNATFKVQYKETLAEAFVDLETIKTDENGYAFLATATYDTVAEGLRRGIYRLVEMDADDQIINTQYNDNTAEKVRNTITFEIGNEIGKHYVIDNKLQDYLDENDLYGVEINNKTLVTLDDTGIVNTPIPNKTFTVQKLWNADAGLEETFRPESIQVQLYRKYGTNTERTYGEVVTISPVEVENPDGSKSYTWSHTWEELPAYTNVGTDGNKLTYLYEYSVKEVDKVSWYTAPTPAMTVAQSPFEPKVKDGDTTAVITNTLTGGAEKQPLTIYKKLGGGSADDVFYVKVDLTKNGTAVGNHGWYLDDYTIYASDSDTTGTTAHPGEDGWMEIQGGQHITLSLPKGVTYQVIEKTDVDGNSALKSASDFVYTPHYDGQEKETIGTTAASTTVINAVHKSLTLIKKAKDNSKIENATFAITYVPLAGGRYVGEAYTLEEYTTNADGQILDAEGNPIDLTNQGTYTIYETKAAAGYITPTEQDGTAKLLATIVVDAEDIMAVEGNYDVLVDTAMDDYLSVTTVNVTNEKTKVRIDKTIDYANGERLENAELEIHDQAGQKLATVDTWTTDSALHTIELGALEEGVIYRLHENANSAPDGYLEAEDVYFMIRGTYTIGGERYSKIYITDSEGNVADAATQNVMGTVYGAPGVLDSHGALVLVDKAIIVPVTLKKMLNKAQKEALANVLFEVKNLDTGEVLGTAKTGTDGYLTWENGETIYLQQNTAGYEFKEIEAPIFAYNDERVLPVNPTDQNFIDYLADNELYLNVQSKAMETKADGFTTNAQLVINEPYISTVTLLKYDADEEANRAWIKDAEFTLFHATKDAEGNWIKGDVVNTYEYGTTTETISEKFYTDENGKLIVEIHNKGCYILEETTPATGYTGSAEFRFEMVDDSEADYGYNQTTNLKIDGDDVPNDRLKGEVTLTKLDANAKTHDGEAERLNGVIYTLTRHGVGNADYLLSQPEDVMTGYDYTAEKVEGGWTLTCTEGTAGTIHISGLNWGGYTLTEKTELSGYVWDTNNSYSFNITAENVMPEAEKPAVTHENSRNEVTFSKVNDTEDELVSDKKPLAGAVFEVHKAQIVDGEVVVDPEAVPFYTDKDAAIYRWDAETETLLTDPNTATQVVSGEDGKVTVYGLPTDTTENAITTYALVEITAPKGYKLQLTPVVFTIDREGNVDTTSTIEEKQVEMVDSPIKIFIKKFGDLEADGPLKGAEFDLTDICSDPNCDHSLADGVSHTCHVVTGEDGSVMIPIETVIGGHTYQLKETKAPKGYECTAIITFTVTENGTVTGLDSEGGYQANEDTKCASLINDTTIRVADEKIALTLTKTDVGGTEKLAGVTFTIKPYGKVRGTAEDSAFAPIDNTSLNYDSEANTYTFTTNDDGKIFFPNGLLIHDHSYLLQEIETAAGYYLNNEAKDGVILTMEKDGMIDTITRFDTYTGENEIPCLVTADGINLVSKNYKSTTFDLTKYVDGNMGDLSGTFKIKMEVYEPDGTKINQGMNYTHTVDLRLKDLYNSELGVKQSDGSYDGTEAFGVDAIPVGATVIISEDNELDYAAVIEVDDPDKATIIDTGIKGTVKLILNSAEKVSISLINRKNIILDVGVPIASQAPWALLTMMLPALWLAYRNRKKRREVME